MRGVAATKVDSLIEKRKRAIELLKEKKHPTQVSKESGVEINWCWAVKPALEQGREVDVGLSLTMLRQALKQKPKEIDARLLERRRRAVELLKQNKPAEEVYKLCEVSRSWVWAAKITLAKGYTVDLTSTIEELRARYQKSERAISLVERHEEERRFTSKGNAMVKKPGASRSTRVSPPSQERLLDAPAMVLPLSVIELIQTLMTELDNFGVETLTLNARTRQYEARKVQLIQGAA